MWKHKGLILDGLQGGQASLTSSWWFLGTKADHCPYSESDRNGGWAADFFHVSKLNYGWIVAFYTSAFQLEKSQLRLESPAKHKLITDENQLVLDPWNCCCGFQFGLGVLIFICPWVSLCTPVRKIFYKVKSTWRCTLSTGREMPSLKTENRTATENCYSASMWSA